MMNKNHVCNSGLRNRGHQIRRFLGKEQVDVLWLRYKEDSYFRNEMPSPCLKLSNVSIKNDHNLQNILVVRSQLMGRDFIFKKLEYPLTTKTICAGCDVANTLNLKATTLT